MDRRQRFRHLVEDKEVLVVPGTFNAFMAQLIEDIGFKAIYVTGSGVTNSQLGMPDLSLLSFTELFQQTFHIIRAVDIPVIVDIDTGFGSDFNVQRSVQEMEHIGVCALQIEDQIFPKRCGHFEGKQLISQEEMEMKISIAVKSRRDKDLLIIARTDAIYVEGFERAIERAKAYEKAGADILFVEAPESEEEVQQIPSFFQRPTLINIVEGGKTPLKGREELEEMGYSIILYANACLRGAAKGAMDILQHLYDAGTTADALDKIITFKERNRITRVDRMFNQNELYKEQYDFR